MAITIGTMGGASTGSLATVTTLSTTTKLVALVGTHQGTISGITFNGSAMTFVVRAATAFNETAEIWYMDNPGAVTNGTITGTFGGSGPSIGYINLEGTATGAPAGNASNTGADAAPTVSITPSTDNNIVISSAYAEDVLSVGTGETLIFSVTGQSFEDGAGSYNLQTTATAEAMDYTMPSGQRWAVCAVAIAPVAAASTQASTTRQLLTGVGM